MFLNSNEVQLENGYLVNVKYGKPIYNERFINLQKDAHKIVLAAKELKGKTLKGSPDVTISDILTIVAKQIELETSRDYKEILPSPSIPVTNSLKKEALDWIDYQNKLEAQEYINQDMQHFNYLLEFEEIGLYFEPYTTRLSNIYTIKEILEAITELNTTFQTQGISTLLKWSK